MTISGRYRSDEAQFLELRVDVDGPPATRRISGDLFERTGQTVQCRGSFVIDSVAITDLPEGKRLIGELRLSRPHPASKAVILVSDSGADSDRTADVQLLNSADEIQAQHLCRFKSPRQRRVSYVQDHMEGLTPFDEYDTQLLPSGGNARVLALESAFAEAGIELVAARPPQTISGDLAGEDRLWSRSELHGVMTEQLASMGTQHPGWLLWLFVAHESDEGFSGLMFDNEGLPRQGCAVFHNQIAGNDPHGQKRAQLRTYVHEVGHCFNLYHSNQKSQMLPPQPNRPGALSWMNYPKDFRTNGESGEAAYWSSFTFQFDSQELLQLRHGFFDDVVMGGKPLGSNAADVAPFLFDQVASDSSQLCLHIKSRPSFALGEPVVVELKLSPRQRVELAANERIHPKFGHMAIGIIHPSRGCLIYRPLFRPCSDPNLVQLDPDRAALYDSAYIGFGRDGHYFDEPGTYQLRAVYTHIDGSQIVSNKLRLRVRAPRTNKDESVADLLLGDQQGVILSFLGCESDVVYDGNQAIDELLDRYRDHPLAIYGELVRGFSNSRRFKKLVDEKLVVSPADNKKAEQWLKRLIRKHDRSDARKKGQCPQLDNITLNATYRRLAEIQATIGKADHAESTLTNMCRHFRRQKLSAPVVDTIESQAENTRNSFEDASAKRM
jgi:hypothetical protein